MSVEAAKRKKQRKHARKKNESEEKKKRKETKNKITEKTNGGVGKPKKEPGPTAKGERWEKRPAKKPALMKECGARRKDMFHAGIEPATYGS